MIGLRRVRDHIPKKETVADVVSFRRELVSQLTLLSVPQILTYRQISCICMSLFACESTFRTGAALPQFLPSPQAALDALVREKELHSLNLRSSSDRQDTRSTLSNEVLFSFSLAENWLLQEFVNTLEEIVAIGRRLHGVKEWMDDEIDTELRIRAGSMMAEPPHAPLTSLVTRFGLDGVPSSISTPNASPPLSPTTSIHSRWI